MKLRFLLFFLLSSGMACAQSGGRGLFSFLDMGNSPRAAALGTSYVSLPAPDLGVSLLNPSIISPTLSDQIGLNFVNYFSGVNYGFFSYGKDFEKIGSFVGHLQYANYGQIQETNEYGDIIGRTGAMDFSLVIGWGRKLDSNFSVGANFKYIFSYIDAYNASAISVDVAASYISNNKRFSASLFLKNMGTPLSTYNRTGYERLGFEVGAAISHKAKHAPFRLHLALTHLEKWDLSYTDPLSNTQTEALGEEVKPPSKFGQFMNNTAKHFVPGIEFLPFKSFSFSCSYNYLQSKENRIETRLGMVGFSWGIGLHLKKIQISYARSAYHLVGSPNYIGLVFKI